MAQGARQRGQWVRAEWSCWQVDWTSGLICAQMWTNHHSVTQKCAELFLSNGGRRDESRKGEMRKLLYGDKSAHFNTLTRFPWKQMQCCTQICCTRKKKKKNINRVWRMRRVESPTSFLTPAVSAHRCLKWVWMADCQFSENCYKPPHDDGKVSGGGGGVSNTLFGRRWNTLAAWRSRLFQWLLFSCGRVTRFVPSCQDRQFDVRVRVWRKKKEKRKGIDAHSTSSDPKP